mgnify:FL=1
MSKAYWIATYIEIFDADKLASYAALALPAITAAGGRFMARGMPDAIHEAGKTTRTVIIEFESVAAAEAAYESEAYSEALAVVGDAALRDIRIIAGA